VTPLRWGPNDLERALAWWGRRVERGFARCERVPAERVLVVQMEELVAFDRERQYERLLAFLGVADHPTVHTYFNTNVTEVNAHIARWRQDVPADQLAAFEARHARIAQELEDRGRPYTPVASQLELEPVA
jgi:hypothetical protein